MMVQRTGRAKSLKLELLMASAYCPELKKEALQPRDFGIEGSELIAPSDPDICSTRKNCQASP
jgi:hypothetical protein